MITLLQILAQLPGLRQDELLKIKTRVDFLVSGSPQPYRWAEDWLIAGVYSELQRRGLMRSAPPPSQIDRARLRAAEESAALLLERVGKNLKAVEKAALGQIAARALADMLVIVAPLSLKVMMNNIEKVPQALDAAFPGYLEAGMIELLLKRKGVEYEQKA